MGKQERRICIEIIEPYFPHQTLTIPPVTTVDGPGVYLNWWVPVLADDLVAACQEMLLKNKDPHGPRYLRATSSLNANNVILHFYVRCTTNRCLLLKNQQISCTTPLPSMFGFVGQLSYSNHLAIVSIATNVARRVAQDPRHNHALPQG